jgi:hypothetical protein
MCITIVSIVFLMIGRATRLLISRTDISIPTTTTTTLSELRRKSNRKQRRTDDDLVTIYILLVLTPRRVGPISLARFRSTYF